MNIIIAGDGEVGFHLASSLTELEHNIVVVDPHKELLQMIESETDLLTIAGNSTSPNVLKEADCANADLLISVLHDETINLLTCILGKKLGAQRTIARINNIEFLTRENKSFFRGLGIDEMVCPERIAAKEIVNLLNNSAATEIFDFSDGLLTIYLLRVEDNTKVLHKTFRQVGSEHPDMEAKTIALVRNGKTIIPKGEDIFQKNDLVYVIAKPSAFEEVQSLLGKSDLRIKSAIIAGGGRIGTKTAKNLEKRMSIKMIDSDKERCYTLAEHLTKTLIIHGDATNIDLLEDEGIANTDAFIAVTDSTETNILTCLHARKHGVKKTIALVENIDFIDLSQDIGIDTIINKKLITASYIARFTLQAEVNASKWLSGTNAEAIEFIVHKDSPATKKKISDLKLPQGTTIGGIIRDNDAFIARQASQIQAGDKVVAFTIPQSISELAKLFN